LIFTIRSEQRARATDEIEESRKHGIAETIEYHFSARPFRDSKPSLFRTGLFPVATGGNVSMVDPHEKAAAVATGGRGHAWLDARAAEDAVVMVSAGEYDDDWWAARR
jgi:hypothetical protein